MSVQLHPLGNQCDQACAQHAIQLQPLASSCKLGSIMYFPNCTLRRTFCAAMWKFQIIRNEAWLAVTCVFTPCAGMAALMLFATAATLLALRRQ